MKHTNVYECLNRYFFAHNNQNFWYIRTYVTVEKFVKRKEFSRQYQTITSYTTLHHEHDQYFEKNVRCYFDERKNTAVSYHTKNEVFYCNKAITGIW